jgi:hypothetical protein
MNPGYPGRAGQLIPYEPSLAAEILTWAFGIIVVNEAVHCTQSYSYL